METLRLKGQLWPRAASVLTLKCPPSGQRSMYGHVMNWMTHSCNGYSWLGVKAM